MFRVLGVLGVLGVLDDFKILILVGIYRVLRDSRVLGVSSPRRRKSSESLANPENPGSLKNFRIPMSPKKASESRGPRES